MTLDSLDMIPTYEIKKVSSTELPTELQTDLVEKGGCFRPTL